jgi:hypothetical protein
VSKRETSRSLRSEPQGFADCFARAVSSELGDGVKKIYDSAAAYA